MDYELCEFFFFFAGIVAFAIFFLIYRLWWHPWVEKKIKAICEREGYKYYGKKVPGAVNIIRGTPLDQGHSQQIKYGIGWKFRGIDLTIFSWQYTTGGEKSSEVHVFSMALMPVPFRDNARISIRKELWTDRVKNIFGYNDLDFENKEFSDRFYVKARPERFGYDFFHPRMMELFLSADFDNMIVKDGHILLYLPGALGKNITSKLRKGINPFLPWMNWTATMFVKIRALIPLHILKQRGMEEKVAFAIIDDMIFTCPHCSTDMEVPIDGGLFLCPNCERKIEI